MMSKLQGIVLFCVVALLFGSISLRTEVQQNTQNDLQRQAMTNQDHIRENQQNISLGIYEQCLARNEQSRGYNSILNALIIGAQESELFSKKEKEDRIARYTAIKIPPLDCNMVIVK